MQRGPLAQASTWGGLQARGESQHGLLLHAVHAAANAGQGLLEVGPAEQQHVGYLAAHPLKVRALRELQHR